MSIVPLAVALQSSQNDRSAWLELASGRASDLEKFLGPAARGEHLPGLGDLLGWGFLLDGGQKRVTGAIYTGFLPDPESVSIVTSAFVSGEALSLAPLAALLTLPASCLNTFIIRSLVGPGPCYRVTDHGSLVLATRSVAATNLCCRLLQHLAEGAQPMIVEGSSEGAPTLWAQMEAPAIVSKYNFGPTPEVPGAVPILDWGQ